MIISQSGVVDLIPEYNRALRPIFCVSEGDAGSRMINLTVQNAGENFTIPAGAMVYVAGRKKDNAIFSYQCMFSGYIVTFPVSAQMSAEDGIVLCELQIVVNSEPLGSANFVYWVEPSPIENGIASESDLNIFEQAIALLSNFDHFYADVEDIVTEAVSNIQIHEGQTVIDASLSVSGAAADAKATGDKIKEMYGAFFEETVTGETVTFDDGAEGVSVKQIVADILPMQNLNGYDHPWPGGSGKNIIGRELLTWGKSLNTNGEVVSYTENRCATENYIDVDSNNSYIFSTTNSNVYMIYAVFNGDTLVRRESAKPSGSAINVADGDHLRVCFYSLVGGQYDTYKVSPEDDHIQIEVGSTATTYEPYSNVCPITGYDDVTFTRTNGLLPPGDVETYTVTMPTSAGTVYGGTLTVNDDGSGTIVVDRASIEFDGSQDEGWIVAGGTNHVFRHPAPTPAPFSPNNDPTYGTTASKSNYCNCVRYNYNAMREAYPSMAYDVNGRIYLAIGEPYETLSDCLTWLAANPVQYVYYIAEPITYALTAPQVKTLLGDNSISMDANGEMTVTYRVNTAIYIDKRIAAIIGTDGNAW